MTINLYREKLLATVLLAGLISLSFNQTVRSAPIQLLTNGDFETGSLVGWTVTDLAGGSGSFFTNSYGATTPLSSLPTPANATGGLFFAVSDQVGAGTHALTQSFSVAPGTSVSFSFDMFLNDYSPILPPSTTPPPPPPFTLYPIVDPSGLDHTTGGASLPNQHARVDILTGTALPFSTAPADIVMSILAPVPAPAFAPGTNPFLPSPIFDLSGALAAGGTFQVRFAEVDNFGNLNLGVDNVSILANVPVPGTLTLFGLGLAGLTLRRNRQLRGRVQ